MSWLTTSYQLEKLEKSIADTEMAWGTIHPNLADKLQSLADLYFVPGHYEKAEPLYWRLVEIRFRFSGERHPDTVMGLINLADNYNAQNQNEEAAKYYSCATRALIEIANYCGGLSPLLARAGMKLVELKANSVKQRQSNAPHNCSAERWSLEVVEPSPYEGVFPRQSLVIIESGQAHPATDELHSGLHIVMQITVRKSSVKNFPLVNRFEHHTQHSHNGLEVAVLQLALNRGRV